MQALCQLSYSPVGGWIVDPLLGSAHRSGETGSIGPQPLQVVEVTGELVEDVDDEVAKVEQQPLGILPAFAPQHIASVLRHPLLGGFGEGEDVATRGSGSDDEHIGDDDEERHVEDRDPQPLLGVDGGSAGLGGRDGFLWQ